VKSANTSTLNASPFCQGFGELMPRRRTSNTNDVNVCGRGVLGGGARSITAFGPMFTVLAMLCT
jgi:hypothetical protein